MVRFRSGPFSCAMCGRSQYTVLLGSSFQYDRVRSKGFLELGSATILVGGLNDDLAPIFLSPSEKDFPAIGSQTLVA
jgi:hypothetical protein